MKGLFLKDIYELRKPGNFLVILTVIFVSIYSAFQVDPETNKLSDCLTGGVMFAIMFSFISLSLVTSDERSKWDKFCISSPVSKKQFVSEKYLLFLFFSAAASTIMSVSTIVLMIKTNDFNIKQYIFQLILIMCIPLFMMSICVPLLYRYGASAGAAAFLITFLLLVGCLITAVLVSAFNNHFKYIENFFIDTDKLLLTLGALVLFGGIYAVSWMISIKCIGKRED